MTVRNRLIRWMDTLLRSGDSEPLRGQWLRLEHNETHESFVVQTGRHGVFTAHVPGGWYTLRLGLTPDGPWDDKPVTTSYEIPQAMDSTPLFFTAPNNEGSNEK